MNSTCPLEVTQAELDDFKFSEAVVIREWVVEGDGVPNVITRGSVVAGETDA